MSEKLHGISLSGRILQAVAFVPDWAKGSVYSTGFNVVQPVESIIIAASSAYCLSSPRGHGQFFEVDRERCWVSGVDDKDFKYFHRSAPPAEQQRIAAYLDASCAAIDAAVAAKRRQIETLDALGDVNQHHAVATCVQGRQDETPA